MLDDNSVGNTRNTVTFIKAYFGKKRSCWYKKDPLPFSGYNLRKDVGGKDYSRTAAAASSCVGILFLVVIGYRSLYEWEKAGYFVPPEDPGEFSAR
mgnify:CR=1 FL=1